MSHIIGFFFASLLTNFSNCWRLDFSISYIIKCT